MVVSSKNEGCSGSKNFRLFSTKSITYSSLTISPFMRMRSLKSTRCGDVKGRPYSPGSAGLLQGYGMMNLFRWFLQCGYIYIGYEDVRSVHPFYTSYQAQVCMPWLQSFQNRRAGEKIFNSFLIIHVICYTLLYIQIIPEKSEPFFQR